MGYVRSPETPASSSVVDVILSDNWNEQGVVRVAKTLAGWPNCLPSEFMQAVATVLDKLEEYRAKGLSMADLSDLALRARMAEEEAQPTYVDDEARYGVTNEARHAVQKLFAHDFPADVTARVLGLEVNQVEAVQKRLTPKTAEVVRLHRAGHHPHEIAARLDMSWTHVERMLNRLGYAPNYKHHQTPAEMQEAIRADRAAGLSLNQIAKKRGVTIDRVKNAVYGARGKHRRSAL